MVSPSGGALHHQHGRWRIEEEIDADPGHRRQHERDEEHADRGDEEAVALAALDAAKIEIEIALRVARAAVAAALASPGIGISGSPNMLFVVEAASWAAGASTLPRARRLIERLFIDMRRRFVDRREARGLAFVLLLLVD